MSCSATQRSAIQHGLRLVREDSSKARACSGPEYPGQAIGGFGLLEDSA